MIEISDADPERAYDVDEERALTEQLAKIVEVVHQGALRARPLDLALACDLHASLFDGVRGHAGRHRRSGRGSERLTFGPHRSCHRDHVEARLEELFRRIEVSERRLEKTDPMYELAVLEVAVRAHADFIQIHPFEDGNGRVGRLLCSHLLVRHGLRPIPIEAVKQEYTEALNHYFIARDPAPLVDLYVRLYPVGR